MDGGKERDILATQDEILGAVNRLSENQEAFETLVNGRFDRLQNLIVGNGENERAILPRVRIIEKDLEDFERRLLRIEEAAQANTDFIAKWRNRVIGILIAWPTIFILITVIIARIFAAGNAP